MNKKYHVRLSKDVQKQLKKMDKFQAKLIINWLYTHIDGSENPYLLGKGLTTNRVGQWRYRIGKYRAICLIDDNELIVEAINVGHRRNVYDGI